MPQVNLLIVDGDNNFLKNMKSRFSADRFQVYTANNCREGMEIAQRVRPDLIISNIDSPKLDGWSFCQLVKTNPLTEDTPFILVANKKEDFSPLKAVEVGSDDFLVKPFGFEDLLARVEIILKRVSDKKESPSFQSKTASASSSHLSLADLLQVLGMNQKTCTIMIEKGELKGKIFMEGGVIKHAFLGDLHGDVAVYEQLRLTDAEIIIKDGISNVYETTIDKKPEALLLTQLTRLDNDRKATLQEPMLDKLFGQEAPLNLTPDLQKGLERIEALGLIKKIGR
ncbi:hypothetical protein CEE39_03045 [bacterium (candidate division B38) B3_B38]|nr:MAG: hypothetical protein CEE39_03045 [bacterium (candidate division B38) B3_B38]